MIEPSRPIGTAWGTFGYLLRPKHPCQGVEFRGTFESAITGMAGRIGKVAGEGTRRGRTTGRRVGFRLRGAVRQPSFKEESVSAGGSLRGGGLRIGRGWVRIAIVGTGLLLLRQFPTGTVREPAHADTPLNRVGDAPAERDGVRPAEPSADLLRKTATSAAEWRERLGPECASYAAAPFVLAGDLDEATLRQHYERTVRPAAEALKAQYFRAPPDAPIVLLLFSDQRAYVHYARELFGDEGVSVYGYYKPDRRLVIADLGTGGGTLVHELTHALLDFDFADAPVWFNEGLASLHEESRFVATTRGLAIEGLDNWRLTGLQAALADGELRPLRSLIADADFRRGRIGLNYAQARYFCLYLQERGLTTKLYTALRDGTAPVAPLRDGTAAESAPDPTGLAAVEHVLWGRPATAADWERLDAEFRTWVAGRELPSTSTAFEAAIRFNPLDR